MRKVVIDTNIIISAALSPKENPAKIMNLFFDGEIQIYYCMKILNEYKSVLSREKLNITDHIQENIIVSIGDAGVLINPVTSDAPLPDESDRIFYDTAKESKAILVTGNIRHYPVENSIMTPTQFLALRHL